MTSPCYVRNATPMTCCFRNRKRPTLAPIMTTATLKAPCIGRPRSCCHVNGGTWSRKIPCSWWAIIISAGLKTATSPVSTPPTESSPPAEARAPAGLHHAIHLPAAVHRVAGEMSIEATASHDGGADAGKLGAGTREVEIRDRRLEGRPAEIDVPRA